MFYTYALLHPLKPGRWTYGNITFLHQPFYIGKGSNKRASSHLNFIKKINKLDKTNNTYKNVILKNLLDLELTPYIMIIDTHKLSDDAFIREIELIAEIGRKDKKTGPLANLTDGGEGISNISNETKLRMSESHKGKIPSNIDILRNHWKTMTKEERTNRAKRASSCAKNYKNTSHLESTIQKISIALTGIVRSTETKQKMSEAAFIRESSKTEEQKTNIASKISETRRLANLEPHNKIISKDSDIEKKVMQYFNDGYSVSDIFILLDTANITVGGIRSCIKRNGIVKLYRRSKL